MSRLRVLAVALLLSLFANQLLAQQSSAELVTTFRGHTKTIRDIQFSHSGEIVSSISDDKTVRLWSVATGKDLATIVGEQDAEAFALKWSEDDRWLAITDRRKKSWELVHTKQRPGNY